MNCEHHAVSASNAQQNEGNVKLVCSKKDPKLRTIHEDITFKARTFFMQDLCGMRKLKLDSPTRQPTFTETWPSPLSALAPGERHLARGSTETKTAPARSLLPAPADRSLLPAPRRGGTGDTPQTEGGTRALVSLWGLSEGSAPRPLNTKQR